MADADYSYDGSDHPDKECPKCGVIYALMVDSDFRDGEGEIQYSICHCIFCRCTVKVFND